MASWSIGLAASEMPLPDLSPELTRASSPNPILWWWPQCPPSHPLTGLLESCGLLLEVVPSWSHPPLLSGPLFHCPSLLSQVICPHITPTSLSLYQSPVSLHCTDSPCSKAFHLQHQIQPLGTYSALLLFHPSSSTPPIFLWQERYLYVPGPHS